MNGGIIKPWTRSCCKHLSRRPGREGTKGAKPITPPPFTGDRFLLDTAFSVGNVCSKHRDELLFFYICHQKSSEGDLLLFTNPPIKRGKCRPRSQGACSPPPPPQGVCIFPAHMHPQQSWLHACLSDLISAIRLTRCWIIDHHKH